MTENEIVIGKGGPWERKTSKTRYDARARVLNIYDETIDSTSSEVVEDALSEARGHFIWQTIELDRRQGRFISQQSEPQKPLK